MLEKYKKFIKEVDIEIRTLYEDQKPFLKCKSGCAECCKDSGYRASKMEFDYIKEGMKDFSIEKLKTVKERAFKIIENRNEFLRQNPDKTVGDFAYECPFLFDDVCNIYEYRPIICRIYGLLYGTSQADMSFPKCMHYGLNYANVFDKDKRVFIIENFRKYNINVMPNFINYGEILKIGREFNLFHVKLLEDWITENN